MRTYPEDEYDLEDAKRMKAEQWQLDVLKLNPDYVYWGNYEDCMYTKDAGWRSPIEYETFEEFVNSFGLDDLNEMVNFYFNINRESDKCTACDETGYNPATKRISDDWYDFERTGRRWDNKITQHEVNALIEKGRLRDFTHTFISGEGWKENEPKSIPTAEEINLKANGKGLMHDAINRGICVQARAEREGVYGLCKHCEGHGYVFTQDYAKLGLQLWIIHPRKGASRGVYVKEVKQDDLQKAFSYLKEANERNNKRFSLIP